MPNLFRNPGTVAFTVITFGLHKDKVKHAEIHTRYNVIPHALIWRDDQRRCYESALNIIKTQTHRHTNAIVKLVNVAQQATCKAVASTLLMALQIFNYKSEIVPSVYVLLSTPPWLMKHLPVGALHRDTWACMHSRTHTDKHTHASDE